MKFVCPFTPAVAAIAAAIKATPGFFGTVDPVVHLMQNNPAITSGTVLADLVEANYSNYEIKGCFDIPFVETDVENGKFVLRYAPQDGGWVFSTQADAGGLPQTFNGIYLTNNAGTVLIGVGKFDTPKTFTEVLQFIMIGTIEFQFASPILGG